MDFDELIKRLGTYLPNRTHFEPRDPFNVLISTILSQRTRDEQTAAAAEALLSAFPSVEELAEADIEDIEVLIRPAGFYRVKARKIKEVSNILLDRYNGIVPRDFETLITLPSVGRKTANCVLVFGFGQPAIPVDTHVHRISNRLGIVGTTKPHETEKALREVLPKRHWLAINHLFVAFGRTVCRPIAPKCRICPVSDLCSWEGKRM